MKKNRILLNLLPCFLLALSSCGSSSSEGNTSEMNSETGDALSSKEEETSKDSSDSSSSEKEDEDGTFSGIVRVHFRDDAGTAASKAIYCWISGVNGVEYAWDGESEGYGVYKDIDLSDERYAGKVSDSFFFIIKFPGTWVGQSDDIKISLSDYLSKGVVDTLENGRKRINVYACDEGGSSYVTYYKSSDALGYRFSSATLESDWKTIKIACTGNCLSYSLYALDARFASEQVAFTEAKIDKYLISSGSPKASEWELDLSKLTYPDGRAVEAKPTLSYGLIGHFEDAPEKTKTKFVTFDKLYDTEKFISDYTYEGDDLGVSYSKSTTIWNVWSPISCRADVLLYKYGEPNSLAKSQGFNDVIFKTINMRYCGQGVYSTSISGDYSGWYYLYRLYYNGWYVDTPDPYATSCGLNGVRSGIIDFESTNPEGWDEISFPELSSPSELTVYEVHVRDLTSHSSWKSKQGNERGSFNAFHESGTGYNGVTTGFDHIKELGVNAVQLLPVFDQDNDERTLKDKAGNEVKPSYNWGYNPQNYNCVEGSYSSDPYNAKTRVKEFKSLVKDYADSGIRIIMDVVYNHVSSVSSHPFSLTVPRYYFRYDEQGVAIDDTGCSNTVNSSRVMASRYIVNSVKWWAKEYKIKGFRFDLMGCLETDTMRAVKDALYQIDPEIVVYGEGWTGSGSHASSPANTENIYAKLGDNGQGAIGSFNDCYRDGMKGNTTYGDVTPSGGFMDSYSPSQDQIWNSATGMIGENRSRKQGGLSTPASMSVNYLTCHDNYTLYDQMNYLLNGASACAKENQNAKEASLAANVHSLMCQGIAFLQGGEEFFRTKVIHSDDPNFDELVSSYQRKSNGTSSWIEGDGCKIDENTYLVRNSYKYGDAVNGFDYSRKVDNENYFLKFKEAIKLRSASFGTYLGQSQEEIEAGNSLCLGGGAIGGAFLSEGKTRIVLTTGRKGGSLENIPSSLQGEYKVVYCSSSRLEKGDGFIVSDLAGSPQAFETLILEKE